MKSVGGRLPKASGAYFATKVREQVPACISSALLPLLEEIENLTVRIREYDKQIEDLATTKSPRTQLMRQIRGVGVVTSLAFALTIDDPSRFHKSRDVGTTLACGRSRVIRAPASHNYPSAKPATSWCGDYSCIARNTFWVTGGRIAISAVGV